MTDYISDTTDPSDGTFTYCGGSGWVAYKDEKCFKLIKKWATHDEAETICNQEYFRTDSFVPTLVSIKSSAEQEYLTKFVFNTSDSNKVWIGAKRRPENGTEFVWNDGSIIDFDNWAEGSPTEETKRDCVEMQSEFSKQFSNMSDLDQRAINGKWNDVTCNIGNWVLCQKLQTWSFPLLQKIFLDSRKELQNSLNDVTNQLSDTKNDLTITKNELTTTKNNLINTNNELTTTKNNLINTNNELTTTKNDLINTKNQLTTTKNELTSTKNGLEVLQKNPSKLDNAYFMHLLIHTFYSPNRFHLCSAIGSTRTEEFMVDGGMERCHFRLRWTFLPC